MHNCFGSNKKDTKAKFGIYVDPRWQCNEQQHCNIHLGYLHSWDKNYIGTMSCSLYVTNCKFIIFTNICFI
jgi:hypothetical protein